MNSKSTLLAILTVLFLLPTAFILAATPVKTLVGIPGITDTDLSFGSYINALYGLSISIAALLAVIKIIIAGMKYMLSDIVTSKADAIKDIRGALLGLLIVISAVLVLNVINPQLTETTVFTDLKKITATPSSVVGNGTGSGGPLPTPPVTSLNKKIDCETKDATSCTAAKDSCRAESGNPSDGTGALFGKAEILCSFGTEEVISCGDPSGSNTSGQPTYDCYSATNKCSGKGGTVYKGASDGSDIKCLVPKQ